MKIQTSTATVHPCTTFRPLPGQDVCGACRWNGAAHWADTSEPAVTSGGVTTQVAKRAAVLTPDISGVVLDTAEVLAAVAERVAARGAWLARRSAWESALDSSLGANAGHAAERRRRANVAGRALDDADQGCKNAQSDLERAVRMSNRDASEAQINAALRSL